MPIRLRPGGGDGYASTGQRIGAGLFGGIADLGDTLLKKNIDQQSFQRTTARELLKDYTDKVISGALDPEQASAAMASQGFRVPADYFKQLQPSVEQGLQKIVGGMTKAQSPQEVEGRTALASEPTLKRIPFKSKLTSVASQPDDSVPSGETLPSKQAMQFSPEFDRLLKIRDEKLNAFEPKQVATIDADGNKTSKFVSANPETLIGQSFQTEPSPDVAGRRKAMEAITQANAENVGGLPQAKGRAFTAQADLERGARAATAGAEAGASTNARIGAETSPGNVAREASKQAAITTATTTARDEAMRAGIPPEIANNYVRGTLTKRSYAYIPADVPSLERSVIIRGLATSGIPQLDKSTAEGVENIQKARANYQDLVDLFATRVAADPKGRAYASVKNTLGTYMQTDPQLAAAVATSFPQVINLLKANAGTIGRIMEVELRNMSNVLPQATDTLQAVREKQLRIAMMLKRAEDAAFSDYSR